MGGPIVFVIRLLNGEEINGAENDELAVNEQTGVLTVTRVDGFEEVTTHYSPSAWASVTHRVKEPVVRRPIAAGTKNFCVEPAMTREEAMAALALGIEMADRAAADGCTLAGIGEMGIGNTTVASAVTAALTGPSSRSRRAQEGWSSKKPSSATRPQRTRSSQPS